MGPGFALGVLTALASPLAGCTSEALRGGPAAGAGGFGDVFRRGRRSLIHRHDSTWKPRYESDLGFRVSGKIIERLVNIGDRIAPGMTLARLDASDYRLSLELAEAELNAARSSLKTGAG